MKELRSTVDRLKDGESRVVKAFVADVKAVDGDAPNLFRFTITTNDVDRDRDIIDPAGWKIDSYLRNPVVLWAHDYSAPPIAMARTVERTATGLVSEAQFVDAAVYPFAGTIAALVKMGALSATSVGFRPIRWSYNEERKGVDFQEQELLEYSICPVPANPNALIEARAAGIDVEPLREWAAKTLERIDGASLVRLGLGSVLIPMAEVLGKTYSFSVVAAGQELSRGSNGIDANFEKGSTPSNPMDHGRADEGMAWAAPMLGDFTADAWGDLSDAEKRKIARHFAWAAEMPPAAFGSLKLPHHRASDGSVVWNGVRGAMGALLGARGGVDIPEMDRKAVYAHLKSHYAEWDKEAPELREHTGDELSKVDAGLPRRAINNPTITVNAVDLTKYIGAAADPIDCPMGVECPMRDKAAPNPDPFCVANERLEPAIRTEIVLADDARAPLVFALDDGERDLDVIDIEAIAFEGEDELAGITSADVLAAMREGIGAEAAVGVRRAMNVALGRVD